LISRAIVVWDRSMVRAISRADPAELAQVDADVVAAGPQSTADLALA
jgi:hypothetical protein